MNLIKNGSTTDQLIALQTKIAEQDNKLDELLALLRLLLQIAPRIARRPIGFNVNS